MCKNVKEYRAEVKSRDVGRMIKHVRSMKGMLQIELAEKAGLSQSEVSSWEHGRHIMEPKSLGRIAKALGITVDELTREVSLDYSKLYFGF